MLARNLCDLHAAKNIDISSQMQYNIKAVGTWLSLVERYIRDVEVASSNLVVPIGANVWNFVVKVLGIFCISTNK